MVVGLCWLCGEEAPLRTSWKIDDGEHEVCGECDWKIDQIIKHYGGSKFAEAEIASLVEPGEGFDEHCFCNRGLRMTPNGKKFCTIHGYEYQ